MASFAQFGNDLFTGRRQINFIGRRRTWYLLTGILLIIAAVGIFGRGLNFSLEFEGGSHISVANIQNTKNFDSRAHNAVKSAVGSADNLQVTKAGATTVTIESKKLGKGTSADTDKVAEALAKEFHVKQSSVSTDFIGPSWGSSVTHKAIQALIVFLLLLALLLSVYFRTWTMAAAALVALVHDLFFTVGIYALTGIEISPATMIGFLTILGYSIYDTVVVFDKVRENTDEAIRDGNRTYAQAANYAVNQTLVRSINTSVVALLPITAIMVVGIVFLGPGTLLDLAVALFFGIAVGTYSSIFIATPLLTSLRHREANIKELDRRALAYQTSQASVLARTGTREQHTPGESSSGVIEPERAKAAKAAAATKVRHREIHPLAKRDDND
ncbi:protein-export membrane protein SecF [Flexivirga endophytica]|uniref:Protein-export membrane protein SecF n=1 Tax=Flexivirga endophytica TaxID=1849103 RepID=A0A916T9M3_9MICO|nr:protein translocase subunit SecF [Flexivirga endophytica]GGB37017.1 protein-export membrane protein SecF [Flexivirga endophytica]GHB44586.1 protein-export membrane protein SecF [Flexivirga endophytica]